MLQDFHTNEMSGTLLSVLLVQAAIEKVLLKITVVGRTILHFGSTVSAVKQTRKDTASSIAGHPVSLLPDLLHPSKHILADDGFMGVRKDRLLFYGVLSLLLVPDRDGVGLEVNRTTGVFSAFQNLNHRAVNPSIRILW